MTFGVSVTNFQLNNFELFSQVGKERNMVPVMRTTTQAEIMNPLLDCSSKEMRYLYSWEPGVSVTVMKQEVTLTNLSAVALSFFLKTDIPFNLSLW